MGTITSGIGLISGINTAQLIDQLIALESRPKTLVQQRVAELQVQKTAFVDVNGKFLSLKTASASLVNTSFFKSTKATSTNEDVLTASSSSTAAPGTYNFTVDRLVSTQQMITQGYIDRDQTAVGAGTLSFEFGNGRLDGDTRLTDLNAGAGVNRGKIRVTDRSGAAAVVDLSRAVTVNDVLEAINSTDGINVSASVDGDGLKITDASGGEGTLSVANVGTTNTAGGLGLTVAAVIDTLTGSQINKVGTSTRLDALNDGNGVRIKSGLADFQVTHRDGTTFDVNLDGATTLADVISKINTASAGSVTASINGSGTGLTLVDAVAGGSDFSVTALNSSNAAADLGILATVTGGSDTLSGQRVIAGLNSKLVKNLSGGAGATLGSIDITNRAGTTFSVDLSTAQSVGDVISLINAAGATGGRAISASLNNSGNGLLITDATAATAGNLIVTGVGASDLGIDQSVAASTINSGNRQIRYVSEATRLSSLNGGAGVTRGKFVITDSNGVSATVDLTQGNETTIQDVLSEINTRGLALTASINTNGDGILLTDTGTGAVKIKVAESGSTTAADLGLLGEASSAGADLDGSFEKTIAINNVIALAGTTLLSDLNGGAGVRNTSGSADFRITRRDGATFDVDLDGATTIADVISRVSTASGGLVTAAVNGSATGLTLTDSTTGTNTLTVSAINGSDAATDLGILANDSDANGTIDGVSIAGTPTLDFIANKINAAGYGVSASVVNDGSSATPWRLVLTASRAGHAGQFVFDDGAVGLGSSTLSEAHDALAFFGNADPAKAIAITSTSNTLSSIIPGATISLVGTSSTPVQINISRDTSAIVDGVQNFVDAFNDAVSTIDKYDTYNADTNQRGPLFGDSTASILRASLFRQVISSSTDLTGRYSGLLQIGIRISGGQLTLDTNAFNAALETDPAAVQQLFTYKTTSTNSDGVVSVVKSGMGVRIDEALKRFTDGTDGTLQLKLDNLDKQVEASNKRIAQLDDLLAAKKARLEAQFGAMEKALAQLQHQSSALAGFQPIQSTSPI